jgi:hypothetical protein
MAEFFWPYIFAVVGKTVDHPDACQQVFNLVEDLILKLVASQSKVLDLADVARQCGELLLQYTTSEVRLPPRHCIRVR